MNIKATNLGTGILLAALAVGMAGPAIAATFKPNVYYRLTTQFRGPGMCLDVYNEGEKNNLTHLSQCGNYTGQYWNISWVQSASDGTELYRLTTQFRGKSKCLDVVNGGPNDNHLILADCGNYSGQYWHLLPSGIVSGTFRLNSTFRAERCADIFNGGPDNNDTNYAPCVNASGQYWSVTPTDRAVPTDNQTY